MSFHVGDDGAQAAHIAEELELKRRFPVVVRERLEHAAGSGARVVDQDIDPAQCRRGAFDERLCVRGPGQIGGDGHDFAPGLAGDFTRRFLQRFLVARADRNIDALARQAAGDHPADPGAAAGHRGGLSFELQIHGSTLP